MVVEYELLLWPACSEYPRLDSNQRPIVYELAVRAEDAIEPTRSDQALLRGFVRATGLPIRLE